MGIKNSCWQPNAKQFEHPALRQSQLWKPAGKGTDAMLKGCMNLEKGAN